MPSWLTYPSTDCTRCSSGSSEDRGCGYRAMISMVRCRVRSSKTGVSGDWSWTAGSHSTPAPRSPYPFAPGPSGRASGCPSGSVMTASSLRSADLSPVHTSHDGVDARDGGDDVGDHAALDRKSTRLNSSHANISYAVFCLKK